MSGPCASQLVVLAGRRGVRGMAARRVCTAHAALAWAAAVLLAAACHLAPPPYARIGSGLGVIEGQPNTLQAPTGDRPCMVSRMPPGGLPAAHAGNGLGVVDGEHRRNWFRMLIVHHSA